MSEKTKKLLILNLPYAIIGLIATNVGEAWRIAVGETLGEKILAFLSALGTAFSNPLHQRIFPSAHRGPGGSGCGAGGCDLHRQRQL